MRNTFRMTALAVLSCFALFAPLASHEEKSESDTLVDDLVPGPKVLRDFIKKAVNSDKKPEEKKEVAQPAEPAKKDSDFTPREETAEEAAENIRLTNEARAELKRKGDAMVAARNDTYRDEFGRIQIEDASTLRFLSTDCTNNDNPSGSCMNSVSRARKVDERMKALLAKDGAEKYFREGLKTDWRPESPVRAAAVRTPHGDNSGNQAARDQVANTSYRSSDGGFLGCKSARTALVEYHGTTRHAEDVEASIRYSWNADRLMSEIASIQQSGQSVSLENVYKICALRARWAELKLQEPVPPQAAKDVADAQAKAPKTETAYTNEGSRPVGALQNMLKDASNQTPSNNASSVASQTAASMTTVTGDDGKSIGPSGPPIPEPKKKKIGLGNLIMGAAQGYVQYKAIKSGGGVYPGSVGTTSAQSTIAYPQSGQAGRMASGGATSPVNGCISVSKALRPLSSTSQIEQVIFRNNCPYVVGLYVSISNFDRGKHGLSKNLDPGGMVEHSVARIQNGQRHPFAQQVNPSNFFACRTGLGYGFSSSNSACYGP